MPQTSGRVRFRLPVGWLLVVTVLVCLSAAYLQVWLPFQRRVAVIRQIELGMGGRVDVQRQGPDWLRDLSGYYHHNGIVQNPVIGILDRIVEVDLSYQRRDRSKVTDDFLPELRVLHHVQEIDLSYTKVTDEGMKHVAQFKKLRQLDLGHTRIDGRGFRHLSSLPNLETVILSDTPIRVQALQHLKANPSLRNISLHACRHLSIEGVARFQKDRPDCTLYGLHHAGVHLTRK